MVVFSGLLRSTVSSNTLWQLGFLQSLRSKLADASYRKNVLENAKKRGEAVDIDRIHSLVNDPLPDMETEKEALALAMKIPNWLHPNVPIGDESAFVTVKTVNSPNTNRADDAGEKLAINKNWLRYSDVGLIFGPKTYAMNGPLSELESALIKYALNKVSSKSFHIVHVPELVTGSIINGCGFPTDSYRSQVYKLGSVVDEPLCLIGTAEMALAGYVSGRCFPEKVLPLKLCAVSRCFRAEASDNQYDKGLYRVHQFYKVEMFVVGKNDVTASNDILEDLVAIEEEVCKDLGLGYRVLDIASRDLGLPAFRKYDIEAWLPGHGRFGEVTSASSCIDWQASRLGIRYKCENGSVNFAHTLNGTALAVPRILIALLETHQHEDGILLPDPLRPFFGGSKVLGLPKCWRSSPAQNVAGLLDAP